MAEAKNWILELLHKPDLFMLEERRYLALILATIFVLPLVNSATASSMKVPVQKHKVPFHMQRS